MTRSCFFGFLFLFFTMRFIFHPNFGEYVLLFPNIKQANLLSTCFGPPLLSHRCWSFWRKCLIIRSASVFSRFVGGSSSQFSYVRMTLGHFLGRGLNHFYQGIMITHPHCFSRTSLRKKWVSLPSPAFVTSWSRGSGDLRLCQFLIVGFLLREVWIPGVCFEDGKVCPSLGVDLARTIGNECLL